MTLQNAIAIVGALALLAIVVRGFFGSSKVPSRDSSHDHPHDPPSPPPAAD
jgi:hypothetical protein